jgi:hypothetical protein
MRALLYALRQTPTIPCRHEQGIETHRVHVDFLSFSLSISLSLSRARARVHQVEF